MNACVQSVKYSANGQTTITIGPAQHLGAGEFIDRMRNNLGSWWYNIMQPNPLNTGSSGNSSALGTNLPVQAPETGAENWTFQSLLATLPSQQGSSGNVATLAKGVHFDSGAVASPFTGTPPSGLPGNAAFSQGPMVVIANGASGGTPGEQKAWIRMSLNDLNGANMQIYLMEIPVCVNVSGTNTAMFQIFLCSLPYDTSIFA